MTKGSISKLKREAKVVWMRFAILMDYLKSLSHKFEVLVQLPKCGLIWRRTSCRCSLLLCDHNVGC